MKSLSFLMGYATLLLLFLSTLVSFSTLPTVQESAPPVEKKKTTTSKHAQKRQTHLKKRYNRLHKRFDNTTNTRQRLQLQKRIRQVERQLDKEGSPVGGIIGFTMAVLGFIGAMLYLLIGLFGLHSLTTAFLSILGAFIFGLAGLIVSIVYTILNKKNPDQYPLKGFALAGLILGSLALLIPTIGLLSILF